MQYAGSVPRLGSAVIIEKEGKVLLGLRNKEPEKGKWILPGGKIEPFETIDEAAKRELLEETGLHIEVDGRVGVYEIISSPHHHVVIYSRASVTGGELRASGDCAQVRFFSREELNHIEVTPLVRKVLTDTGWCGSG